VPDPDPVLPEVIEFSPAMAGLPAKPAHPVRNRLLIAGAAAAVVVIAAVAVFAGIKPGRTSPGSGAAAGHVNPALARLIAEVTGVPVGTSDAAGNGGQVTAVPGRVSGTGSPLTANGKPEVFYVGEEFCPYCATQSWAIIVALSRFGTFTGLSTVRSVRYRSYPALATWTFYGSAYTSKYLAFVPVETRSSILISRTASPLSASSYTRLQKLTAAQQAIFSKYDTLSAVPFLDFGNRYVLVGSGFPPAALQGQTWSQVAAALRNPRSGTGQVILGTANYLTAAICALTGDQPATACTPAVRSLLGRENSGSFNQGAVPVWPTGAAAP
jgi:Domain of unknown function (DUF929)